VISGLLAKRITLVFISFSRNNKNVSLYTTDCNRMSATYSYVACGIIMTRLIHVLCACGLLQGLHGGAVLVDHLGHASLTLTLLMHEYHVNIQWCSVLCSLLLFSRRCRRRSCWAPRAHNCRHHHLRHFPPLPPRC
jgi:hypothetical protein